MKLKEIRRIVKGRFVTKGTDALVNGFSIDSRTIKPGEVFIAIKGRCFDGHNFIGDAVSKGAVAVIMEDSRRYNGPNGILVDDTYEAMASIASSFRNDVYIPVICVTGTNGKTTVKDMLSHILEAKYKILKSRGSFNNLVGLCLTLFALDSSHEIAVLEIGTNHPGEISRLADIAKPYIAVITNIGHGHLESFTDTEGVFLEKIAILNSLSDKGTAFLNKDDKYLSRVGSWKVKKKFFGNAPDADHVISGIRREDKGYIFFLDGKEYYIPVTGEHNVYNAAAAISVAVHMGMEYKEIKDRLGTVTLPEMRLEEMMINDVIFVNDAYNSNPDSFMSALEFLKTNVSRPRKIMIAGDMLELGEKSDELHWNLGMHIAQSRLDRFIALGEKAAFIARGAVSSGMDPEKIICVADHADAARVLHGVCDSRTIVLLKGSRRSKMEEIIKCFTTSCIR